MENESDSFPKFSPVHVFPHMYSGLLTGKCGKDINHAVISQQPGPPDTLFQLTSNGMQLYFLQQRASVCCDQEAVTLIFHPP